MKPAFLSGKVCSIFMGLWNDQHNGNHRSTFLWPGTLIGWPLTLFQRYLRELYALNNWKFRVCMHVAKSCSVWTQAQDWVGATRVARLTFYDHHAGGYELVVFRLATSLSLLTRFAWQVGRGLPSPAGILVHIIQTEQSVRYLRYTAERILY